MNGEMGRIFRQEAAGGDSKWEWGGGTDGNDGQIRLKWEIGWC